MAVDLPAANAEASPQPEKQLVVTLKPDLAVVIGQQTVSRATLSTALDTASGGNKQQRVFLRADKSVSYGALMDLMNELRSAGYLHVALVGLEAGKLAP